MGQEYNPEYSKVWGRKKYVGKMQIEAKVEQM